jgi:outer membrane protein TolC
MGGKISSAYRMARIGNKVAELNMELTRAEVIVKADEAYWTCIKTRELVKLAQSYRDLIESLLRDVENARDVGLRHQNDVLKVQVKLNEAELQLRRAQNGLKLAMMNLCFVTGLPLDADVKLPESLEDAIAGELDIKRDYTGRPEYAMLEQQILLKEQEIKLTRSDFLPQVGLAANYGYINGLEMNGTKLLDGTSFSALVSVNIPLFHWGEGRNKIKAAEAEKEIASLQRENLSQMMELELAQAINKLDESLLEAEFTEKALKEAEENLRVSENRYKTGMQTLSEFMEAQSMWQNAYSQYIDALSRLQLNHTYYLKASGKL